MLVAIIDNTTPSGKVPVKQFRVADSEAQAVTDFVNTTTPPRSGSWIGKDTGWGSVQAPAAGNQWSWDFDGAPAALVETLIQVTNQNPVRMEDVRLDGRQYGSATADDSNVSMRTSGMYDEQTFDTTSSSGLDSDGRYLQQDTSGTSGDKAGGDLRALAHRRELNSEILHKFKLLQTTDIRFFAAMLNSTLMAPALLNGDNPTVASVGVRYSTSAGDTTFHFISSNGTTHNDVDSGVPISTDAYYTKTVADEASASFTVMIFDRTFKLLAKHTFTTNIPAAADDLGSGVGLRNLVNAVKSLKNYLWQGVNKPGG